MKLRLFSKLISLGLSSFNSEFFTAKNRDSYINLLSENLTSIFVGELAVVFMVMFPVAYLILSTNRELKEELQELRNQVKNLKTKLEYLEEE